MEYLDSIESSGVLGVFSEGGEYFNSRLYTSREYDSEIDIYYMRARYYNPSIGRFISRDPIDIEDDINLYSYVGNNPVVWVDLMGTDRGVIREKGNIKDDIFDWFSDIGDFIDTKQYVIGRGLVGIGTTMSVSSAPACASSISVTGGCVVTTGVTGPGALVCTPVGITAGASCGTTATGAGMAWVGNVMMSKGNGGGGDKDGYNGNKPKFENDNGTILKNKDKFVPIKKRSILDTKVYKGKDGNYYYRDNFHKDHLEVFDKRGNHLGEADPITGDIIPGTIDKNKVFK